MILNILFVVVLIGLLWAFMKYLTNSQVYISDKKRHSWKSVKYLNGKSCYCNLCEIGLQSSGVLLKSLENMHKYCNGIFLGVEIADDYICNNNF